MEGKDNITAILLNLDKQLHVSVTCVTHCYETCTDPGTPLGSLSTHPAQHHVTTGTEPDTGRLLHTQHTWLPQLSTRLDCSGKALNYTVGHEVTHVRYISVATGPLNC